jgi:Zn-dependent peptidase ImmA (M78 family)/DNA-binding XRE family transcriptional regulator
MNFSKKELINNLHQARKNSGLSQNEVAAYLGIPRTAISQIETGNRDVSALELAKLADLYGYKISDFFTAKFQDSEISVLLRALPDTQEGEKTKAVIKEKVKLIREIINLRELLELKMLNPFLPQYPVKSLNTKWDAVLQGKELARQERQRLGLGIASVDELTTLMEKEGLMVVKLNLPDDISGITFRFKNSIICGVNSGHTYQRKRFSLAHEYCHALCDLSLEPVISSFISKQKELKEIRANAFAAEFLMPQEGIKNFISSLGKGYPSRPSESVFCEGTEEETFVEGRLSQKGRDIDLWDVNHLSRYFHVSKESTLWQLFNLKLITEEERKGLFEQMDTNYGKQIAGLVGSENCNRCEHEVFPSVCIHLVHLASTAFNRDIISKNKFLELVRIAGFSEDEVIVTNLERKTLL